MNQFGQNFRLSIFGESHGETLGITLDGVKPGIPLAVHDFFDDILRRKAGREGTTPRIEDDLPILASGVYNGHTTGAPLTILFKNQNTISKDYDEFKDRPRPGHADFTAHKKFLGFNDPRGGGHFSGRLTLCLVAAGVVAKKMMGNITIEANILTVGGSTNIEQAISEAISNGDSVGGIVECRAQHIPIGLGEPFFNSIESVISHLAFSIPAIKGIEFGSGFAAATMHGSEHNDRFVNDQGKTETNHSGGILGGITNGNELVFRVAVKPTASISQPQTSFNFRKNKQETMAIIGRHDSCIALRVPVVLEAITAIALVDFL
jgi:chorismate synthase